MPRSRIICVAVALVALVVLAFSSYDLAKRIQAFNLDAHRPLYYFLRIGDDRTEFVHAGREVALTWDLDDDTGEGVVHVQYGDDTLNLPVAVPEHHALPGLARFRDWLGLFFFAEGTGMEFEAFREGVREGTIPARLVIVTREPLGDTLKEGRFGFDLDNTNFVDVVRDRWWFGYYEFLPEGGFEVSRRKFPEHPNSLTRRQVYAEQHGEPIPQRNPDEIEPNTWRYDAAVRLMNRAPNVDFEHQALRNAGWTLPVASVSVVVLIVSLAFAFAPRRVRAEDVQNETRVADSHAAGDA